MAVTAQASGTQAATVGNEHTLADVAVAGTFTLHIDLNAMQAGDTVELRIYQIILSGGTRRVAYFETYTGVQPTDDKIKISIPISNELTDAGAVRFTVKQTAGAGGRSFPWKILRYG